MRMWLMSWAAAEPMEVTAFVIAAVFAVLAVVCGVAAWREWQGAKSEDAPAQGTVEDLTRWKESRSGDWGREGGLAR